ncbi:hypothetical protein SHIRM173S_10211 [Streptomyces hirsutus]
MYASGGAPYAPRKGRSDDVLTDEETAALAAIDEAALGRTLLELIGVPSVTGSAAESELQHQLAGRLEWLGMEVDLWSMDLPALRAHPRLPGHGGAPRGGVGPGRNHPRRR